VSSSGSRDECRTAPLLWCSSSENVHIIMLTLALCYEVNLRHGVFARV